MALCGRRALIPAHPAQPSLNLSHAVMVAAYEVFRARRARAPAAGPRLATHGEKERLLELLRDGLLAVGALPAANTEGFFEEWRALFQRADLTPEGGRLLEHLARKMRGGSAGATELSRPGALRPDVVLRGRASAAGPEVARAALHRRAARGPAAPSCAIPPPLPPFLRRACSRRASASTLSREGDVRVT